MPSRVRPLSTEISPLKATIPISSVAVPVRDEGATGRERRRRRPAGHALARVEREDDAEAEPAARERVDADAGDAKAVLPHDDAARIERTRLGDADDVAALGERQPGDRGDLHLRPARRRRGGRTRGADEA